VWQENIKLSCFGYFRNQRKLLSLLVDIRIGNNEITVFQLERNKLNEQLVNTYRGAPKTINKAYKIASKALQKMKNLHFQLREIDKFFY
jgi:hypothetical protein